MKSFSERLKFVIKDESVNSFAKKSGVAESSLRQYINGGMPGIDKVVQIAKTGNVNIEWLATGVGEPQKTYGLSDNLQQAFSHDSLARIPVMNVTASAGGGAVVTSEETDGYLAFEPSWLHRMGLNRAELFTLPTMGESMEPTIKAGEYVLCSSAEHHTKIGDGIYVIRLEGNVLVKRLQVLPGGILEISSDNSQFYKPFTLDMKANADFKILGKVIFVHGIRRI